VLADQVGLDFIGVGEHHRPDFCAGGHAGGDRRTNVAHSSRFVGNGAEHG
jgi:hypothetical protein